MNTVKKLVFFLWLLAAVLITPPLLRSFGLNPKEMMKDLFSDTPRQDVIKPAAPKPAEPKTVPVLAPAETDDDERGRARELRPDISLPPTRQANAEAKKEPNAQEPENDEKEFKQMISGLENISHLAANAPEDKIDDLPVQAYRPQNSAQKVRWLPPPPGFSTADTFNYLIYREKYPVTPTIKTVLDNIHGNLMLDLTPFTIIIKPNKILVMLFGQKDSYMKYTKRPAWSGASSNLQSDTMYVIESNSFYPLSVHELTHLYFDGYFLPTISPLWLSEGMAVYMQITTTKEKPGWVDRSLRRILKGEYIPFEEMTEAEDLSNYSTQQAELWYTQAYSVVAYLLKTRTRDEFYRMCNELKAKTPLHQALYRAYGMPFNRISVLENVWRHDLQKAYEEGKILQASSKKPSAKTVSTGTVSAASITADRVPTAPSKPEPNPSAAPKPAAKPAPQKTKINKLKLVPTNGYKGGFG